MPAVPTSSRRRSALAGNVEIVVGKLSATLIGAVALSAAVSAVTTPALALGGCGPNGHRNPYGYCVFGGQRQAWCLRHKGHLATRLPDGTLRCF